MIKSRGLIIGLVALLLVGCSHRSTPQEEPTRFLSPNPTITAAPGDQTPPAEEEVAELTALARASLVRITTDRGAIDLELYPDDAPRHVANFLKLIQAGFYTGLTFHRMVPEFVVQGGDPNGDGTGGPGYSVPAEFNRRPHVTGTLAMARAADPDSAGSQFYIALAPQPTLDGNYTVFGQVVAGMEVVQQIQIGDVMSKVEIISR